MSKIKVSSIEALSNNTDLTITPNGTGVFEVANDTTDGTLELNSISNLSSVKIQAPPATASQDYSLILPDSDMAVDKYLKVSSITGSGSTAVGQLGYDNIATPSTNLDAAQITSGTVPLARIPTTGFSASKGLGLQHVQTQTIPASSFVSGHGTIKEIVFTGLEDNTMYRLLGNTRWSTNDVLAGQFLDAGGAAMNYLDYCGFAYNDYIYNITYSTEMKFYGYASYSAYNYGMNFQAELQTGLNRDAFYLKAFAASRSQVENNRTFASMTAGYKARIHGIRFYIHNTVANNNTGGFNPDTSISLYKFVES